MCGDIKMQAESQGWSAGTSMPCIRSWLFMAALDILEKGEI